MELTEQQLKNFWDKVEKTDGCWNWTASTDHGYGKFFLNTSSYLAHKVSLIIAGEKIELRKKEKGASGVVAMHTCDNRKCVRPSHLRIATQLENMRDAVKKGRHFTPDWSGDKNPQSRFNRLNSYSVA